MQKSKEIILNNIRQALKVESKIQGPWPQAGEQIQTGLEQERPKDVDSMWEQFKDNLEGLSGRFHIAQGNEQTADIIIQKLKEQNINKISISDEPLVSNIAQMTAEKDKQIEVVKASSLEYPQRKEAISKVKASIVEATYAISQTGTLVFLYDQSGTSYPHFLATDVFAVVRKSNIFPNMVELFEKLTAEQTKNMVFVTGASRTADIEKVLILGAHGPRTFNVIVIP